MARRKRGAPEEIPLDRWTLSDLAAVRGSADARGIIVVDPCTVPASGLTTDMKAHLILYVSDQRSSARFYENVLGTRPRLNLPGMTEFELNDGSVLGLMPVDGIRRLLGAKLPNPDDARGIPRCELYLVVKDPAAFHRRSLEYGGKELSALSKRDWGHEAAYSMDADGHVLVFAKG